MYIWQSLGWFGPNLIVAHSCMTEGAFGSVNFSAMVIRLQKSGEIGLTSGQSYQHSLVKVKLLEGHLAFIDLMLHSSSVYCKSDGSIGRWGGVESDATFLAAFVDVHIFPVRIQRWGVLKTVCILWQV